MAYTPYEGKGDDAATDAQRRRVNREVYERVLSMVDAQTSEKQPALTPRTSIRQIIAMSNINLEQGDRALRRAIERGDIVDYHGKIALATEESLLRIIEEEIESDIPRQALIGNCNRMLDTVRADADE